MIAKNKKKLLIIIFISSFIFLTPAVQKIYAADGEVDVWGGGSGGEVTQTSIGVESGLADTDPRIVVAKVIRIILGFLGIVAISLIMYAGWLYMSSEGNEEKVSQAKAILKNAIFGLIIILSSFAIASFVLKSLLGDSVSGRLGGGGGPGASGSLGALGACVIESVYPEPSQKDVARNTSIILTFKEEVNMSTLCLDTNNDKVLCNCSGSPAVCDKINPDRIKIFEVNKGDSCETGNCEDSNIVDASIVSSDMKTFTIKPAQYLGSDTGNLWYTAHLTNGITKWRINEGVFSNCRNDYFEWQFEVSNKIDLTPPQVKIEGIFPAPDNKKDELDISEAAKPAKGSITVIGNPQYYQPAELISVVAGDSNFSEATVEVDAQCRETDMTITISSEKISTASEENYIAQLSKGDILLGAAVFKGDVVSFPGYLRMSLSGDYGPGNFWSIKVKPEVEADYIVVDNNMYTYIDNGKIQLGSGPIFNSILEAFASHPTVNFSVANKVISLEAKVAGENGNKIGVSAGNYDVFDISPMAGGTDKKSSNIVNDVKDKPRNSIIQINFNEPVYPLSVSGNAREVSNAINVQCLEGDSCDLLNDNFFECDADGDGASNEICVDGKFEISNIYRTVEFIPNHECGVNGCGEKIYCLPENSHLAVNIFASDLADCGVDNCVSRSPFSNCLDNYCQDGDNRKYPTVDSGAVNGVVDTTFNSLDGNRNGGAQGRVFVYNENIADINFGDNYKWSFYIGDVVDLTPPFIKKTEPSSNATGVNLVKPLKLDFDKLLMSSSLKTGNKVVNNGVEEVYHQGLNMWTFNNYPVGYWLASNSFDDTPADGEPDWTQVEIRHSILADSVSYRAQVGSAIKDIYQNCFKPSRGPACNNVDSQNPSCCSGVAAESCQQ